MAVDKTILRQLVEEAAGGDQETTEFLMKKYEANDALAAKFVAGRMTHADYTRKTQELAEERKAIGDSKARIAQMQAQLDAAEGEKNKIMQDLASRRVTVAKAKELFTILRDKYNLDDTDLPGMSDLIATRQEGKPVDSSPDLDAKFAEFKTSLMGEMEKKFAGAMIPEIGSMAIMPLIWNKINAEHEELTGKKLTFKEQQEILKLAQAGTESSLGKGSLVGIWQDQYNIDGPDGLRMKKRDEGMRQKWEEERKISDAKRIETEALNQVTPQAADLGAGPGISAAFKTKFREFNMDPDKPGVADSGGVPTLKVEPGQHVRQDTGNRVPAAQRAAQKYLQQKATKVA